TSSNNESLSDKDVPKDVKIYSNPLFEFDDEYISTDIDEIDTFLDVDISTDIKDCYHDSEGDILYLESLLSDNPTLSLPPKEEMRRLEATGTYTDDEINRLARRGKQRGHIPGVGRVLPAWATAGPSTPASESTFESGGASGSGGCGDDEESADAQEDKDEDGDGNS
ncbi:hypothetical protein Tco_1431864, partial [Tanacetum coccineum]